VLALGVFVMHTVGHPRDSSSAMGMSTGVSMDGSHQASAAVEPGAMAHTPEVSSPAPAPSAHRPVMAMDMLSLCLAVLFGAWLLAALTRSAFARHGREPAALLAQPVRSAWPRPPPTGPDLTLLSVLRL